MNFTEVKKLSKNTVEEWNKVLGWLSQQNMQTVYDFKEHVTFKYMQSVDQNYYKERNLDNKKYYRKHGERYGEILYEEIEEEVNSRWYNIIAEKKISNGFVVHDVFKLMVWPIQIHESSLFNEEIT